MKKPFSKNQKQEQMEHFNAVSVNYTILFLISCNTEFL